MKKGTLTVCTSARNRPKVVVSIHSPISAVCLEMTIQHDLLGTRYSGRESDIWNPFVLAVVIDAFVELIAIFGVEKLCENVWGSVGALCVHAECAPGFRIVADLRARQSKISKSRTSAVASTSLSETSCNLMTALMLINGVWLTEVSGSTGGYIALWMYMWRAWERLTGTVRREVRGRRGLGLWFGLALRGNFF